MRLVLAVLCWGSAMAVEATLTEAEMAVCEAQGGCEFVTVAWLRATVRAPSRSATDKAPQHAQS